MDNGYRCGCCYSDWEKEYDISIKVDKDEKFFQKKSNHKSVFDELSEVIFEKGCEVIKGLSCGDQFAKHFSFEYSFYSEDLESQVEFEFEYHDDCFDKYKLFERWENFEKEQKEKKKLEEKARRVRQLESELQSLKK